MNVLLDPIGFLENFLRFLIRIRIIMQMSLVIAKIWHPWVVRRCP